MGKKKDSSALLTEQQEAPLDSSPTRPPSSGRFTSSTASAITMAADVAYNRLGDPALLDKIDQLFACNVGEYIDLPQLVVVGDQSSGKSSVLEGLTRLPFPRDSGLCTKFATQISFRRHLKKSIHVSIIPGEDASEAHKEKLKAWSPPPMSSLDTQKFAQIIKDVHIAMGLNTNEAPSVSNKTFSRDILKLDIHGPNEDQLSIIDVPGIFRRATPGKTTQQDMQLVRGIVKQFMDNARSVMLAVVPANVDIATQEILEMAKEVDPEAQRTLGVLTKPDLVDGGAEPKVIELIEGSGGEDSLEWSVVRNPGQKDLEQPNIDRQSIEDDFFRSKAPWNRLSEDRRGAASLRKRLEGVLTAHIRREFPKVKTELTRRLHQSQRALQALGPERAAQESQIQYLSDLAMQFREIAARAVKADYGGSDLFEEEGNIRLATAFVTRNDKFLHDMQKYGHEFSFPAAGVVPLLTEETDLSKSITAGSELDDMTSKEDGGVTPPPDGPPTPASEMAPTEARMSFADRLKAKKRRIARVRKGQPTGSGQTTLNTPSKRVRINVRYESNATELDDILYANEKIEGPSSDNMLKWLGDTYRKSRGFELGTFDSALLPVAMKQQAAKWSSLALGYVSDAIAMVHEFISDMLLNLCEDERVHERLMSLIQDELLEKYEKAVKQVRFLLEVELQGTPLTLNHYFNDNLQRCRQDRIREALAPSANDQGFGVRTVTIDSVLKTTNMSNVEHTVREIHDILRSYYKVARKRFVDNVCMHAASYHLIDGPDTPLKLFSPSLVNALTPEQLEEIAGEDAMLKRRRAQLKKEIKELEDGKKILM